MPDVRRPVPAGKRRLYDPRNYAANIRRGRPPGGLASGAFARLVRARHVYGRSEGAGTLFVTLVAFRFTSGTFFVWETHTVTRAQ